MGLESVAVSESGGRLFEFRSVIEGVVFADFVNRCEGWSGVSNARMFF